MEDGAVVNASHKKPQPFNIGDTVEYLITKPEYNSGNVSKPKDETFIREMNVNKPQKSRGNQNASFALSYSKDQIITFGLPTGIEPTVENIAASTHALAEKHLEWLNSH